MGKEADSSEGVIPAFEAGYDCHSVATPARP